MKNRKLIIGIIAVAVIAAVVLAVVLSNRQSSFFTVESRNDGTIAVSAQNAGKDSAGTGSVTVGEGQKLEVRSALNDKGTVRIEVLQPDTTENLLDVLLTAADMGRFELSPGSYDVRVTVKETATGTVDISAK